MSTQIKDLKSTQRARTPGKGAGDSTEHFDVVIVGAGISGSEVPITSPSSAQARAS